MTDRTVQRLPLRMSYWGMAGVRLMAAMRCMRGGARISADRSISTQIERSSDAVDRSIDRARHASWEHFARTMHTHTCSWYITWKITSVTSFCTMFCTHVCTAYDCEHSRSYPVRL